ncbi:hypothetical protein CDL15_Pgr019168 [Punica granatum]|uniref:Uncharacterized protein n=1 Tax=Punica granatum TaxID=22663 RepID=A0A218WDH9_PUNGR|nr:hypothetical protein CDL15_Pgr019168 [Punica granatum]
MSGLYRLIGMEFLCGASCIGFPETKDCVCGGFGRIGHVDFLEIKNKVGLASRKQNQLGGTDLTGQIGKKWLSRRLPVVFCYKVCGIGLLTD